MALNRSQQLLYARALRALDGYEFGARARAIVAPLIPGSEGDAQTAMLKMKAGIEPTPEEAAALAIVIRVLRPMLPVQDDALPALQRDPEHDLISDAQRARWETFRERVHPFIPSIGRVESPDGEHVGTGFVVGKGLLATNRHVLEMLTAGTCVTSTIKPPRVAFPSGIDRRAADIHLIHAVHSLHQSLDVVILRIDSSDRPAVACSAEPMEEGSPVATIGFPAMDQQNPYFLEKVLKDMQGFKCVSVGEVLDGQLRTTLYHDCSTSQGNSGSPLFSLTSGKVVAIHKSGRFMYRNESIPQTYLTELIS